MQDYLGSYLDILPKSDREEVHKFLNKQNEESQSVVTEKEFEFLIRGLEQEDEQDTQTLHQSDIVDPDLYNQFMKAVEEDLRWMFMQSELIAKANSSYERLHRGVLEDLQREIKKLKTQIENLKLVANGENGLIVRSYDFLDQSMMETDIANNQHLFKDRDGSDIEMAVIDESNGNGYLMIPFTRLVDKLRDEKGNLTASIQVIDKRGNPISQTAYPIQHAIDGSSNTYWAEVILADEPIHMSMPK